MDTLHTDAGAAIDVTPELAAALEKMKARWAYNDAVTALKRAGVSETEAHLLVRLGIPWRFTR